jgi:microcystin degradation protein MlrC
MTKVFIAGFQHETNTFAPSLADWAAFNRGDAFPAYIRGQAMQAQFTGVNIPVGGFIDAAKRHGWQLWPSVWAGASPSSFVTRDAFERIAGDIVQDLQEALKQGVDAVYLDLHGAAVAEHADDAEGELLARVRALIGEDMPLVASLDLHANVTQSMLTLSDALVAYRTYPHIDMAETGERAADLLQRRLRLGRREAVAVRRLPYLISLNAQSTWLQPAKDIYVAMADIEKGDGISAALGRHPVFPVMIVRMLSAGEQTGKIDAMLERVADFLDDEIETILNGLTSLIEPLLIVFLGVTVGSIVIAMFLPIFKMSEIISPSR